MRPHHTVASDRPARPARPRSTRPAPASICIFACVALTGLGACLDADGTGTDAFHAGSDAGLATRAPGRPTAAPAPDAGDRAPAVPGRPPGWSADSHGKLETPRYDVLFPAQKVVRLDLRFAAADWKRMQDDAAAILGRFGAGGLALPKGQGAGSLTLVPRDPIYVPATVGFEGRTWTSVGVRYRGNATLANNWKKGIGKLPFRLDFDELEAQVPAIDDQRFFGLKAVALVSNGGDASLIREKVAGDLYREASVAVGRSVFTRLFVDRGAGPEYFGFYTMVEIPSKEMLRARFGDDRGNLYKPDGEGAKLVTFDAQAFEKKTNEGTPFDDIQALFTALHGPRGDAAAWRGRLDQILDTDAFLRWLAVNTTMTNWDTYGMLAHNFYLYGNPRNGGRLTWIPWDHNESFKPGYWPIVYAPSPGLKEIAPAFPLIRYLMDDPVYQATYWKHVRAFLAGPFAKGTILARLRAEHALVAPFVLGPEGERPGFTFLAKPEDFQAELARLIDHATLRIDQATRAARSAP